MSDLSFYGHVLAEYSGRGQLRFEADQTLSCTFSVGQLADGAIVLLADALDYEGISWPPGRLAVFEGTTLQQEQLVSEGRGLAITDLRSPSADATLPLAFDLQALTVSLAKDAKQCPVATEARFGVTNFILAANTHASLRLHGPAGQIQADLLAASDAERVVKRIRTLRAIDVTCELRVRLGQGVPLEAAREYAHTLCTVLSIANGSRVAWVYCDLYDELGQRLRREHRNHVTKRYTGLPVIDYRAGWTADAQRFTEGAFHILATQAEPLLRPAIIDSMLDAKADADFLEARGAKLAVTLEMLRWTLAELEGRKASEVLIPWPTLDAVAPDLRVAMTTVLDAHGVAPTDRDQLVASRSLRRLNQAGAQGGDFGRLLRQLSARIGLRADPDTLDRVTSSRHALVHEGKFYCQLDPDDRSASLPPLPRAPDEYYSLISFLDRVILKLLRYQGPYLDWNVPAGEQPIVAAMA
jgi:hypothetical protein